MTPLKLSLHNFLSYQNPAPLDFSRFDLAVLLGDNGSGKSSILEALTWAVWEKTRAGSSDDLIYQGSFDMWVDFIFEHEKQIYRIFRRRDKKKHGTTTLEFQIKENHKNLLEDDWQTITESTLRLTQEKIINTLKLPYDIFINTSYLRQGRADEFTIKTPSERKTILGDILGLGQWTKLEASAKDKEKKLQSQSDTLNYQITDLKAQFQNKKSVKSEFTKCQKDQMALELTLAKSQKAFLKVDLEKRKKDLLEEKIQNLRDKVEALNNDLINLKSDQGVFIEECHDYEVALKNQKIIKTKYQEFLTLKKKLKEYDLLNSEYQKLHESQIYFDHQRKDLELKISKITHISTCPTCLRKMSGEEAKKIIALLKDDFKKNVFPKEKKLIQNLTLLNYDASWHAKLKNNLLDLERYENEMRLLEIAQNNLVNSQKNLQKIKLNSQKLLSQRIALVSSGKLLAQEIKKVAEIEPLWQDLQDKLENNRHELLLTSSKLGGLEQALKEITQSETELQIKENEISNLDKERTVLLQLIEAFGKKGIQAMIIEQSLPVIEENANQILKKVSSDQMTLKFLTQREKKSATEEMIETLDIKITDASGERDYEMFSGGEAFRINFAVRVALSKFLAARSGIHLKFLAMDEGFGTLDAAGREDLIATINSISEDFAKILIITHIQELKDLFPTQILITKTEAGSQIQMAS